MENRDLALVFKEIADLLEITDGNPFRIRSFRRAAQVIDNLNFSIQQALESGRRDKVESISGIGKGTLERIDEILETGESSDLRKLLEKVPESLLPMLKIPNLGPKKIALFWKELDITSLDQLEKAAEQGKLRDLPRMGEKSEAKILKAVRENRGGDQRFRLDDGREVSDVLIAYLREKTDLTRIAGAGSARRWKETVGDIDILVSCPDSAGVIDCFVGHSDVKEVLAQGDTKASVVLRRGLQADLRVVDDDSFGAAMQYFTGSKEHNVVLRERAKRQGMKINEYGLFRIEDEKKLAGRDEDEIYRKLGLDPIPPELRENRGEIEAAEKGRLPRLIEEEDIRGDLHMHTTASDGRDSIEAMAASALERGYEYIAITEHSKALAMTGGLDEEQLAEHCRAIDKINAETEGIRVLKGIEVDILSDGRLDLSDEALSQLDVVVASVHSRFNLSRQEMTERMCRAAGHPLVNILGHPTGRLLTRRKAYELDIEEVIKACLDNRVCLEINAHPSRLDLSDLHCRMARDMGALISVNCDAHDANMFRYLTYGLHTARRGWLTAEDVINTYPWKRLKKVLSKEEYR
ncbi:MAG TPA: DNA polymerase/3'-5' exonuclease PolX [Acidobacteriota bacterium]|nr:DNA polymerase/3'-5' exonuclease PolX [Acidobacteriota bacterium]